MMNKQRVFYIVDGDYDIEFEIMDDGTVDVDVEWPGYEGGYDGHSFTIPLTKLREFLKEN